MAREASSCDLKELVDKFIPEAIGKDIEKACQGIYPLQNVAVRKVKVLKAPKFDLTKLMEVHGDYSEEVSKLLLYFRWLCSRDGRGSRGAKWGSAAAGAAGVLVLAAVLMQVRGDYSEDVSETNMLWVTQS